MNWYIGVGVMLATLVLLVYAFTQPARRWQ